MRGSHAGNELSGNLSLAEELYFITKINQLRSACPPLAKFYEEIKIRIVELGVGNLDYASKLDRDNELIERLMRNGEELAEQFFDKRSEWPRNGSIPRAAVSPAR
jgi:NTE family protein